MEKEPFNAEVEAGKETGKKSDFSNRLEKLNIAETDLEKISGWDKLSEGQKYLLLGNLEGNILSEVKEEALKEHKKGFTSLSGKKFTEKVPALLNNVWQAISKEYKVAKLEKAGLKEIKNVGFEKHAELIQGLADGLNNFGPDAEYKGGKLDIKYLGKLKNLEPEQQKVIDDFNRAASDYSKIPDEWKTGGGTLTKRTERKQYEKVQEKFSAARGKAIEVLAETNHDGVQALLKMSSIENQIKINQLLNTHPEAEKKLLKIDNKKTAFAVAESWVILEKGLYMAAGFATRAATTSVLGLVGAPLAAGGIGYVRSRQRAKLSLREKDLLSRQGEKDLSAEAKNFIDAEILAKKMDELINKIDAENDPRQKGKLLELLQTRVNYSLQKTNEGLVAYGGADKKLGNSYALFTKIGQAQVFCALNDNRERRELDQRLKSFLGAREKRITAARQKYLNKQAWKGAGISAGFAVGGWLIRNFVHGHEEATEARGLAGKKLGEMPKIKTADLEHLKPAVASGVNSPEATNYLVNDNVLKHNFDLKTELLEKKVTINTLARGQGIGNYANVTNETPVHFVQPDGSVETHGAGEVYVHPGDHVVKTADGEIYVIKDSGLRGNLVQEHVTAHPMTEIHEVASKHISEVPTGKNIVAPDEENVYGEESVYDQPDHVVPLHKTLAIEELPGLESTHAAGHEQAIIMAQEAKKALAGEAVEQKKNALQKFGEGVKKIFSGKKELADQAGGMQPKIEAGNLPPEFVNEHAGDLNLLDKWNDLSFDEQEVYKNFDHNIDLLKAGHSGQAVASLFKQQAENIKYYSDDHTEGLAILKSGHNCYFRLENNGQVTMSVDDQDPSLMDPEHVLKARKLVETTRVYNGGKPVWHEIPGDDSDDSNEVVPTLVSKEPVWHELSGSESSETPDVDDSNVVNPTPVIKAPEDLVPGKNLTPSHADLVPPVKAKNILADLPPTPKVGTKMPYTEEIFRNIPAKHPLDFSHDYSAADQKLIQKDYNNVVDTINEAKKRFINYEKKYGAHPQFNEFQDTISSYIKVNQVKADSIARSALDHSYSAEAARRSLDYFAHEEESPVAKLKRIADTLHLTKK